MKLAKEQSLEELSLPKQDCQCHTCYMVTLALAMPVLYMYVTHLMFNI